MNGPTLSKPVTKYDHHLGSINAPVVIVEYGDFQCPYCEVASSVMDEILVNFEKKICFVYRHFPMNNIHPYAQTAALAAEAAGLQGKFWEMHDFLFANQDQFDEEGIIAMAIEIELDMAQFNDDLKKPELLERIEEDYKSGELSAVGGTPTFFINGVKYEGTTTYEDLAASIKNILEERRTAI